MTAVAIWQRLTSDDPFFSFGLARSLSQLSSQLLETGRAEDALPPIQDAVRLYRELASTEPQGFQADLARSLRFYAQVQASSGTDLRTAFGIAKESVAICNLLGERFSETSGDDLRASIGVAADLLSRLRRSVSAETILQLAQDGALDQAATLVQDTEIV